MDEFEDRLSMGLMREELRKRKMKGHLGRNPFVDTVMRSSNGSFLFPKQRPMTDKEYATYRYVSKKRVNDELFPFSVANESLKAGKIKMDSTSFLYWKNINMSWYSNHTFERMMLFCGELGSSKSIIAGFDIMTGATVSEHLLYRMLERGMVNRNPLKSIEDNFEEWAPLAAWSIIRGTKDPSQRTLIPFAGGALLSTRTSYKISGKDATWSGRMTSANRNYVESFKTYETIREYVATPVGSGIAPTNIEVLNLLNGEVTQNTTHPRTSNPVDYAGLDFNTWICEEQFSDEQYWIVEKLNAFKKKHDSILKTFMAFVFFPTRNRFMYEDKVSFFRTLKSFLKYLEEDFKNITDDPRYKIACSLDKSVDVL